MDQVHVVDEWYALDVEPKLNHKMDQLQLIIAQQSELLKSLSTEIQVLKSELQVSHAEMHALHAQLHAKHTETVESHTRRNDRMTELLEELKILKQRELNMLIREKIPCPFFPMPSSTFASKKL
jgi:hypothetical protein